MRLYLSLLFACALPLAAWGDGRDHDAARAARESARALPLSDILPRIEREFGGRVIKVEFEEEDEGYIYEFKLIAPDGGLSEIEVEAATGVVLSVEGPEGRKRFDRRDGDRKERRDDDDDDDDDREDD